jgi:hypothetical protein
MSVHSGVAMSQNNSKISALRYLFVKDRVYKQCSHSMTKQHIRMIYHCKTFISARKQLSVIPNGTTSAALLPNIIFLLTVYLESMFQFEMSQYLSEQGKLRIAWIGRTDGRDMSQYARAPHGTKVAARRTPVQ